LPKKLGMKEGHRVALLNPPDGLTGTLGALPDGVRPQLGLEGKSPLDVVVLFVTRAADLQRQLAPVRRRMSPAASFWVAWPKKASGVPTDVTEDVVRAIALPTGLVDNKVCAIDETWSGLRLVIRLENRR
jgi:hypothetical protein